MDNEVVTIETILQELEKHNVSLEKRKEVYKAYEIAREIHKNQKRESGEPYIIHPLWVAYNNIKDMKFYDPDTISAALLHDTIEDATIHFTKQDIARLINPTVAELVDGVTNIPKFAAEDGMDAGNIIRIINSSKKDFRIAVIKLSDRLHNMKTLEYKKNPEKRVKKAIETMLVYVPLAKAIGAYQVKNQLEDLSLKYIDPVNYNIIQDRKKELEDYFMEQLQPMKEIISNDLLKENLKNEVIIREQTICSIYKKILEGTNIESIFNLYYLKAILDSEKAISCYRALVPIHYKYVQHSTEDHIREYTNFYQTLNTNVVVPNFGLVRIKVRTKEMDLVCKYGIPGFFLSKNPISFEEAQSKVENSLFVQRLSQIEGLNLNIEEQWKKIKEEALVDHISVTSENNQPIQIKKGSTISDYILEYYPEFITKNRYPNIIINGEVVKDVRTILKNGDRIQLNREIINDSSFHVIQHSSLEETYGLEDMKKILQYRQTT